VGGRIIFKGGKAMKRLIIALALAAAPALAHAEITIITGDDDHMQITTSDEDGYHWKTLHRTGDNMYMEYDGDTGEMRTVFDFRRKPQDNRGQPRYRTR